MSSSHRAFAPGRVNLIGDHTDYALGRALPMAISLGTTATFEPGGSGLIARSERTGDVVALSPEVEQAPGSFAAMVSGVAEMTGWPSGRLVVGSDLPLGSGLSSSASLIVACALAMGCEPRGIELARLSQEAERLAGQDVGLLDQLAIVASEEGSALCIDFATMQLEAVELPAWPEISVVDSGFRRSLADGRYAERRAEVTAASALLGPLGSASLEDIERIEDPLLRRRARHVISECQRVDDAVGLLAAGDLAGVGPLLSEGHRSLSRDFEVSTEAMDDLVNAVTDRPGVFGARMTGGGFGGCVVVLSEPGALDDLAERRWPAMPAGGARLLDSP